MSSRVPDPHPGLYDEVEKTGEGVIKSNTDEASAGRPSGIPQHLWEKFQTLQRKREAVSKKSTERRVKDIQSKILNKVKEELTSEEDRSILKENDVDLDFVEPGQRRKRKWKPDEGNIAPQPGCSSVENKSSASSSDNSNQHEEQSWMEVKKFMGTHDHLRAPHKEQHAPKGSLEKKIDEAVALGDVETAEKLSDHLANRELGKRIADAFDAKQYTEVKHREEQSAKARQKKKLNWRFDHKQRWETKGNM